MTDITPIVFENKEGLKLFGMLHHAAKDNKKDIGIVILSPGVKTRVAPYRLYNKMTEHFVNMGYTVFRFDFYGLGDAEGDIEEEYLAEFYGTVQIGRYINDTVSALDWMEKECNLSKIILAGLCGGAITGLLAGTDDDRVIGLFGLGIPVILDSTNIDNTKYITKGQLKVLGAGYVRKLLNPKAIFRLLTFRSDFKLIGKVLAQFIAKFTRSAKPDKNSKSNINANETEENNYNKLFAPAFFKMISADKKMLFIFSGADRLAWEFEEKFVDRHADEIKQYNNNFETHTVENANHILTDKEWRQEMFRFADVWLDKNFN